MCIRDRVKVGKPIGATIRLIGNSFIVDKTTNPAAANRPGLITGRSTLRNLLHLTATNVAEASWRPSGTVRTATNAVPIAKDPNRPPYAKISYAIESYRRSPKKPDFKVQNRSDNAMRIPGTAKVAITTE